LFGDVKIIIIQLASTHGDPFVRTFGDFKPWKKFIDWLDVKQSNMHGYKLKRAVWNGFDITKARVADKPDLVAQITEMEKYFEKKSCVAIWKTKSLFEGKVLSIINLYEEVGKR
jgi:hypothetical protein